MKIVYNSPIQTKNRNSFYNATLWYAIAAALVFAPIARGAVRLWSITPVLLISYTAVFLWLWRVNNDKDYRLRRTALDLPILLFTVLAVVSAIFSIYKYESVNSLLKLFAYIGIYYVVVNEFGREARKRLIWLVIVVGTALSLFGLFQYFGALGHSWWIPPEFLASTYVNHNHFAGYLELVIPAALVILFQPKSRVAAKATLILALAVMITALILSQSRGAWLSLTISFLIFTIFFFKMRGFNKKSILILFLFLATGFSFIYFGKDIISERMSSITIGEPSPETRLVIWRGTVQMIKDNPLIGTGIGTFMWGFPRYRPEGLTVRANFAHSEYLNMAAEMGISAPFLMLGLFGAAIRYGFSKKRDPLSIGCAIGVLSLALHGLVDFNFHIPANMILFTVYGAIVMSEWKG